MFSGRIDTKLSASAATRPSMSSLALPVRLFLALVVSQNTLRVAAQTVDNDERSGSHLSTRAASGIFLGEPLHECLAARGRRRELIDISANLGLCFILGLGMCLAICRKRRQRRAAPSPPVYVSPGGPPRPRVVLSSQLSARHGSVEDGVGSRYWYQGFRSPRDDQPAATPLAPPPYGHPFPDPKIPPPPPPAYTKVRA